MRIFSTWLAPTLSLLAVMAMTSACTPSKATNHHRPVSRQLALQAVFQGAPTTQKLFMQCVVDTLAQHVPVVLAVEVCNNAMAQELADGMDRPLDDLVGKKAGSFDPASIVANCGGTDPRRADGPALAGLTVPQLRYQMELWKDVRDSSGDANVSKVASAYVNNIAAELERRSAAGEDVQNQCSNPDPETGCPGGNSHTTGEESVCQQVAQTARELLRECTRVGWTGVCGRLGAKLQHCPDPQYAHVDPEVGVACETPPDPKQVIDAWSKRCAQLTDGGTACGGMQAPEGSSPRYTGGPGGICQDPRAMLDPESSTCIAPPR